MNTNFLKTWLLAVQTVFLTVVKKAIKIAKAEAIASAKTYTDDVAATTLQSAKSYTDQEITTLANSVGSITGSYKGAFTTKTAMDAVTAKAGDWAILSTDDGSNESGIYVRGVSNFSFVLDIAAFSEIRTEILASDTEFATGTSTEKTATVKQIKDALSSINLQLADYALKNGNADNYFLVKDAEVNTKQAVNASQFDFTFTEAEAQAAWDAINVDGPTYNFDVTADWASVGITDKSLFYDFITLNGTHGDTTVTDFQINGNRIQCNITGKYELDLFNVTEINAIADGAIKFNIASGKLSGATLDYCATVFLTKNWLFLWHSGKLDPLTSPTAVNQSAITDLCAANGGSATFQ